MRVRRLAPCHVLSRTNPVGSSREQPRWKIASDPEKPSSTTVSLLCPSHSNYLRTCGVVVGLVLQADLTAGRLVWQHVLRRRLRHAPCLELLAPPKEPTLTLHRVHYSERVERGRSTASSGFSAGSACMIPAMARACVFPGAASTLHAGQAQDPG